jgi:hypothetical protein
MSARRRTPPPSITPREVEVPDRKISETILDFGEPLLSRFEAETPIEVYRKAMMIVITIWNAHVMAMPIWGKPRHLEDLEAVFRRVPELPGEPAMLDLLAKRRREMFGTDPRAVGLWDLVLDDQYGLKLRCDARLPHGVKARYRAQPQ